MTREPAYRIPFLLDVEGESIVLRNATDEHLPWVSVQVLSNDLMAPVAPGHMLPHTQLRFPAGTLLWSPSATLQITWLRESGEGPYVWLAVL